MTASAPPDRAVIPAYRRCHHSRSSSCPSRVTGTGFVNGWCPCCDGRRRSRNRSTKAAQQSRSVRLSTLMLLLSLWVAPAYAHKPSDSYLMLLLQGDHLTGQWDIAL